MPNVLAQSGKLTATLAVADAVLLTGHLSPLLDGRMQLDGVRIQNDPDLANLRTYVEPGSMATLSARDAVVGQDPLEDTSVRITALNHDCITLEFIPSDAQAAARYREACSRQLSSPSRPAAMAVTAEYNSLLKTLQQQSLDELRSALSHFIADLTNHMLELSLNTKHVDQGSNPHYQTVSLLRRHDAQIVSRILQQISDYFQELAPESGDDYLWQYANGEADKLDLIDLQKFDDFLAIDRMVAIGEEPQKLPLEALTLRLAHLVNVDPNRVRLPIHVRQLCRALQRALMDEDIPQAVHSAIFDYFTRHFLRQIGGFYEPLNTLLSSHGILPDIEKEILSKGSLLSRNREVPRPALKRRQDNTPANPLDSLSKEKFDDTIAPLASAIEELSQISQQLGDPGSGARRKASPASLYRSVVDALNFKREAEGLTDENALAAGTPMSGTWDGATVASTELDQTKLADAQSIARALSALQRNSQAREDVQQSDSLRAYLASNKDNLGDLQHSSGLTADSLNQLDMVDNLFGTIKSQLDVSSDLKPALGNLQIPLAKLALLDPRFFVDQEHTARTVVDKLSGLAISANFPNKVLEGRINNIVNDIICDYENDDSVFDTALEKIDRLVDQQERALSRNVERVVRTQEGQQRLAEARRAVGKIISARVQPPFAPKILMELIDSGWRELLVLTHVRDGPDSEAWTEQIKTLDLLCSWLDERMQGEIDDDLNMQRSMEAEPFIDLISQQISSALPTNIAHEEVLEELRDVLAGTIEVESGPVKQELSELESEPAEVRARIEDLPRLRRWVKRVEQLEVDSWLTYSDKSGSKKRMQLAWTSPERDRYIFVNERGQKIADLSAIRLARQLSQGVQPPAPADKLSVVDKSMYHTLKHVQKSLSFARNHDSLTKLINRETFNDQMKRAQRHSQLKHSQHAVLYLNIDQFRLVNEVYDRINGDQALLEFAKLLAQLHGKKSSSARIEADEFAVLLLDRTPEEAMDVAEKIRTDIESSSMDIDGENVTFTVSIGVAAIVEHSPDAETVMDDARSAMRHAKQLGRNRVVRFQEDQSRASDFKQKKTQKREDLEHALASDRFILRAQPIVQTAVADRGISTMHYELLLGLVNKDGSLSSPSDFIESAERYGFMTLVDRWVVREAFTWISKLMDEQKVVPHLAINLSGASVTDDSFMEYLLEQISVFGVGTSRLCFEITETGTISNLVKAADFVRAFRNIGCKFSIDDFGTGLASHNYLHELPVDYVKIDGSFITGIDKSRTDYAMARSINDLAHFLGQETIAESVENDDIIVKLEELGVDYLQGWGIARPKPLADVTADLSNLET